MIHINRYKITVLPEFHRFHAYFQVVKIVKIFKSAENIIYVGVLYKDKLGGGLSTLVFNNNVSKIGDKVVAILNVTR